MGRLFLCFIVEIAVFVRAAISSGSPNCLFLSFDALSLDFREP